MRDPYKTLGVRQDAGADEIKAAWRTLAKAVHPDHNRDDPSANARFAEVGRAYETLKDPKKRSRYDQVSNLSTKGSSPTIMQQRQAAREAEERAKVARANAERVSEELARATAQKAAAAPAAPSAPAAEVAGATQARTAPPTAQAAGTQPFSATTTAATPDRAASETAEDMVERIFGARAAAARNQQTSSTEKPVDPPPHEVGETAPEDEALEVPGTIAAIVAPFSILTSLVRRLTGAPPAIGEKAPDIAAEAQVTLDDIINGRSIAVPLADNREVRFDATAGLRDGHVVRLKGQGLKLQGMQRGDVAVTVHLLPHERFTVKGIDLHTALPLTIENAVLGWEGHVEGLHGRVAVTVPAWSGSDHVIRIPGQGLADSEGGKGDLVIELRLMLWDKPDHKMTDLMRSMKNGLFL